MLFNITKANLSVKIDTVKIGQAIASLLEISLGRCVWELLEGEQEIAYR